MNKIKFILGFFLLGGAMYAQETAPNYLLYRYNMNILNPAYAGVSEDSEIGLGFRKQASDFDDSATTQYASFSMPLKKNLGIGASLVNDKVFITKETSVVVDVSYKLQMDAVTNLYLGLKAGGAFHNIDYNSLGVNDPLFSSNASTFSPQMGVGAYLKGERYFINLSSPNLILSEIESPKLDNTGAIISESVEEKFHVYVGGGYTFKINQNIDFTPSVFSRFVSNEDMLLDVSAVADFSNKIEAGLTYRVDTSIIGSVMLKVVKNTSFGYAYESVTSDYSAVSTGTHEFVVRFVW